MDMSLLNSGIHYDVENKAVVVVVVLFSTRWKERIFRPNEWRTVNSEINNLTKIETLQKQKKFKRKIKSKKNGKICDLKVLWHTINRSGAVFFSLISKEADKTQKTFADIWLN